MTDVLWTPQSPVAAPSIYSKAFLAARVAGAASDGSLDVFRQASVSDVTAEARNGLTIENVVDGLGYSPI